MTLEPHRLRSLSSNVKVAHFSLKDSKVVESEEPHLFNRNWAIPWFSNFAIWLLTLGAILGSLTIANQKLLVGPLPKAEAEIIISFSDPRTVVWPLAAVLVLLIFVWLLGRKPSKVRKGRKSVQYLITQLLDEFRSFSLNAGSLLASVCYYTNIGGLILGYATSCWIVWAVLHWRWLKKNGPSPFDA